MTAELQHLSNGGIQSIELSDRGTWSIGRQPGNDIMTDSPAASRHHATIQAIGARFRIVDAGSRNGTLVNDRLLTTWHELEDGDVIAIGSDRFVFRIPDAEDRQVAHTKVLTANATQFMIRRDLVTVMVFDLRGYTQLAQQIGEERVTAVMSDVFRTAGEAFRKAGCWAQKYIGDAIMGVWVHQEPVLPRDQFVTLLALAIRVDTIVADIGVAHGLQSRLRVGGAIHSGFAVVGNMGGAAAADFTAMGDTVNRAFRLEASTRDLDCDFVIASSTLDQLRPSLQSEAIPPMVCAVLKGYECEETVSAFTYSALKTFALGLMPDTIGVGAG
jgi:adenylate cyclase